MPGQLVSVDEAIAIISDGVAVACAGLVEAGHPEALTATTSG
jgi:acyl CoA:acetate/3-ketoacid CoA transferase